MTKRTEEYKFKGSKKTKANKTMAIAEMRNNSLNISHTCRQIGVARRTMEKWREKDSEFKRAWEDVYEEVLDDAETMLQRKIHEDKDTTSLIFFLKTKAKQRGYIEKREVEHLGSANSPVVINLVEKTVEEIKSERASNKSKAEGNAQSP